MAAQEVVKAFLIDEWANDAVEVQSSGDTSVTLALPISTDLTALVYDLKEDYGANCDLQVGSNGVRVVVHTSNIRQPNAFTYASTPVFMWGLLCVALLSVMAGTEGPLPCVRNRTEYVFQFIMAAFTGR